MPSIKLTERVVKALEAPDPSGTPKLYWDQELKGFGVLVSGQTNSKSYVVQRHLPNGRTRRVTIEKTNSISLDKARKEAEDKLHDIRTGNDPKAARRRTASLQSVLDDYLKARKDLSPRSAMGYRAAVEKYLKDWLSLPLIDITPDMVRARHTRIKENIERDHSDDDKDRTIKRNGNATANGVMRALRALYNFAAERSPLPPNPVKLRKQWFPVERRERIVRGEELPKFFEALCDLPSRTHSDYLKLLLFTGLRRNEAASLTWDDVDLAMKVLRVPAARTKANRKLDLPMSDFVSDLLVARRALGKDGSFVFPSDSKSGYLREPKFPLAQVALASGINVSAHDLRRTFISIAESTDISPIALKALVNHSVGNDVTSGYIIMTMERLRDPAQRVADRLKELCKVAPPAGRSLKKLGAR